MSGYCRMRRMVCRTRTTFPPRRFHPAMESCVQTNNAIRWVGYLTKGNNNMRTKRIIEVTLARYAAMLRICARILRLSPFLLRLSPFVFFYLIYSWNPGEVEGRSLPLLSKVQDTNISNKVYLCRAPGEGIRLFRGIF